MLIRKGHLEKVWRNKAYHMTYIIVEITVAPKFTKVNINRLCTLDGLIEYLKQEDNSIQIYFPFSTISL